MDDQQVGQCWNENAEAWTALSRAGFDVYRDFLNTPAFFELLPSVKGLSGIDIGCGEGHNTRLLAQRGARLKAIDIAGRFIEKARALEATDPLGIDYAVASAMRIPYTDECFDFAASFMCLMDLPDAGAVMKETFRILKPRGFFQFSITHPCFTTPHRKNLRDATGRTYAIEVGDYFYHPDVIIEEWIFSQAPDALKNGLKKFRIPVFAKTLSQWVNMIIDAGFILERVNEPCPTDEALKAQPALQDASMAAYFLHFLCRKP